MKQKIILTTKAFVMKFGTEMQQIRFEKDNKLGSRTRDSIVKIAEQDYTVEIVRNGRSNLFMCTKRDERVAKKDGRVRSGREQVEHRIPLDIIVANYLEHNMNEQASMSLGRWAIEFELITELECDLLRSRHSSKAYQKHVNMAIEKNILKEDQTKLLDEFMQHSLGIYGQLLKTLEHMEKCGIITLNERWVGYSKNGKINISAEIVKEVQNTRKELMRKLNVVDFNLTAHRNARKVQKFKREWKQVLAGIEDAKGNTLSIKYYWKEYNVVLKAKSKAVQRYLEMYCPDMIEAYMNDKTLFINENEADYMIKRKINIMKKVQKKHEEKLNEYKQEKVEFANTEDEEIIRYFYTQQELEDIIAGYELGVKKLHIQNLYIERMEQLFNLYSFKIL